MRCSDSEPAVGAIIPAASNCFLRTYASPPIILNVPVPPFPRKAS